MKQGIPKSVQDLLARQTAADEHPSADLLNGYMEQSLAASEKTQVTKHLAACSECREIVFLASGVQQEEMVPAVAAVAAQPQQVVAPAGGWKSGWVWWKWAVPAVAVIAVAGGVLIQQIRIPERAHPAGATLARNYPTPSTATTNRNNALVVEAPARPAAKASQAAPTESKKQPTAGARSSAVAQQAQLQQQARERAIESAQLSSLEKPRPRAAAGAVVAMPPAPRATPTPSLVSGDFTGTVTDPSGAVVANATITLRNNSTGQTRTTTATNNGSYRFSLLQPGTYTVTATASGFSKAETTAMINAGQATVGDVKLPVGASSQTVEVTSAAPLVQADNADLSTNFDQNVVQNAPNGGNDLAYRRQSAPSISSSGAGKDQTGAAASLKSGLMGSGQPAAMNKLAKAELPRAHWRISADGHLERALPGTAWTRVLADQPVAFRVVATIGSNVWAGGNGGALFHSADQGDSWNKIVLNTKRQAERRAIVSIHFDNAVQGSVTTDSGATWTTSDGGQTWIKR